MKDAALDLGIRIKTVGDLKIVRGENLKVKPDRPEAGLTGAYKTIAWDRTKALEIRGLANCGKTNWALSQFEKPKLVSDIDDLKSLPEGCDGLVFDEMIFDMVKKQTKVYLTDTAFGRTFRCRHTTAHIPAGMPRIFICNEHEYVFGQNNVDAVTRRYVTMNVDEPMWE
jgi:hypothetical protein